VVVKESPGMSDAAGLDSPAVAAQEDEHASDDSDGPDSAVVSEESMFPTLDTRQMMQLAELQLRKLERDYTRTLAGMPSSGDSFAMPSMASSGFMRPFDGEEAVDSSSEEEEPMEDGVDYFAPPQPEPELPLHRPVSPLSSDVKASIASVMSRFPPPPRGTDVAQVVPPVAAVPPAPPTQPAQHVHDKPADVIPDSLPSVPSPVSSTAASAAGSTKPPGPVVCLVVGMAGSGKTTLMQVRLCAVLSAHAVCNQSHGCFVAVLSQRINAEMNMRSRRSYIINLDPAVVHTHYESNIDIRDSVNYKGVMKDYGLGPNGAIITSLNLFATKFHEVMQLLEARAPSLEYACLALVHSFCNHVFLLGVCNVLLL
jgi:hypothetical protein